MAARTKVYFGLFLNITMGVGVLEAQGGVNTAADPHTVPHPGHLSRLQAQQFSRLKLLKKMGIRKTLEDI